MTLCSSISCLLLFFLVQALAQIKPSISTTSFYVGTFNNEGFLIANLPMVFKPTCGIKCNSWITGFSIQLLLDNKTILTVEDFSNEDYYATSLSLYNAAISPDPNVFLYNFYYNSIGNAGTTFPVGVAFNTSGFAWTDYPVISFYGFIYASSKVASHDLYATFTFNYVSNPQPTPDLVVYETFDVTGRNDFFPLNGSGGVVVQEASFNLTSDATLVTGQAGFTNQAIKIEVVDPATGIILCTSAPIQNPKNNAFQTSWCAGGNKLVADKAYSVKGWFNNDKSGDASGHIKLYLTYN